jgi:hypothetical protein
VDKFRKALDKEDAWKKDDIVKEFESKYILPSKLSVGSNPAAQAHALASMLLELEEMDVLNHLHDYLDTNHKEKIDRLHQIVDTNKQTRKVETLIDSNQNPLNSIPKNLLSLKEVLVKEFQAEINGEGPISVLFR